MAETIWRTYPCVFKWAKVFDENMDKGGDANNAAKTVKKRGGQYSIEMVVSDAVKERMIKDGVPAEALGYQMFKPSDDFEGFPWAYRARRYVISNMKDEKGKPVKLDPPIVANLNEIYEDDEGKRHATLWDFSKDGEIGNGSSGDVTISIYKGDEGQRVITLQKVGVKEHVPYEESEYVMY